MAGRSRTLPAPERKEEFFSPVWGGGTGCGQEQRTRRKPTTLHGACPPQKGGKMRKKCLLFVTGMIFTLAGWFSNDKLTSLAGIIFLVGYLILDGLEEK